MTRRIGILDAAQFRKVMFAVSVGCGLGLHPLHSFAGQAAGPCASAEHRRLTNVHFQSQIQSAEQVWCRTQQMAQSLTPLQQQTQQWQREALTELQRGRMAAEETARNTRPGGVAAPHPPGPLGVG